MRSRGRTDENQSDIVKALRAAHRCVVVLSNVGGGLPDLLVGFQGVNYLLEVKRDKKAELTPDQIDWHAAWRGQRAVITSAEDAIEITSGRRAHGFYITSKEENERVPPTA